MKILICVDRLTGGGAQRVASMWINAWVERGHNVDVVLSNTRTKITYPLHESVRLFSIDIPIKNRYLRYVLKKLTSKSKFRKILREVQPDVVISVLPDWGPLIFATKGDMDFKVIGTDHNSYERPASAPMPQKQIWKKFVLNKQFDHVTVLTEADKKVIGTRLDNVTVLPNPLAFEPVKNMPSKKKIVLAMGRLDSGHCKGFDVLIKAFSITNHSGWRLRIVGSSSPNSLNKYKQLAKECNVFDDVDFIGFTDNPIQEYRDASVFCLSSRYEGFGLVLIEAMSQGCACVACDYKGRQSEIITSENEGLLCQPDNPEELAKCLQEMMENDEYRTIVQSNSPLRAACYDIDNIMDRWNEIFTKCNL